MSCFVTVSPRRLRRARRAPSIRPVVVALVTAITLLVVSAILSAAPAHSAWLDGGTPVVTAPLAQQSPVLVSDGAGGAILAWHDSRSGHFDIYAQRIDAASEAAWSTDGVAVAVASGTQKFPVAVSDGAGGVILAWKDDRAGNFDIRAQHLNTDGIRQWGADGIVACGAADTQQDVELVEDGEGGAILVWRDFRAAGVPQLYAQRLSAAGAPQWAANGIPLGATRQHYSVSLAADGAHGAFVAWYDYRSGAQFDIYAQHLTGSGTTAWTANGVAVATAPGNQMSPRITGDGLGGIFIGWYDARNGGYDIYVQRLDGTGATATGWPAGGQSVCLAINDQFEPVMTPDGAGGVFVAWYDNRATVGVYASRLTATGQLMNGWPANGLRVNQSPSTRPAIFPGTNGGAIVAWNGTPGSTNLDVLATELMPDGHRADGWPTDGLNVCIAPGDQTRPQGIALPNGDVFLAWSDMRSDAGDIYVTRLSANLPNLSVEDAGFGFDLPLVPRNRNDATPSQVRLTPVLDGGQATTNLNWSVLLEGSTAIGTWGLSVELDGLPLTSVPDMGPAAPGTVIGLNQGPWTVPGGRHTLTLRADVGGVIRESAENDNVGAWQFIWSPLAVTPGMTIDRPAPPSRGTFAEPNGDGLALTPSAAWGVAALARQPTGDVDLLVYDDCASSTRGFSHRVGTSAEAAGRVDWVVGTPGLAPALYPMVIAGVSGAGADAYHLTAADAAGRRGPSDTAEWTQQSMPRHHLLDVYDLDLVAGRAYYLTLVKTLGAAPVEFHVLPAAPGAYGPDDALATSTHRTPDGDGVSVMVFVPPTSGRYPVAVARTTAFDINEPVRYHFVYTTSVSGVGDPTTAQRVVDLAAPSPNPMTTQTRLELALPEGSNAAIRLYDVRGRFVATLLDGYLPAGRHAIDWDGRTGTGEPAASGIYFVRSSALAVTRTQRLILSR